LGIVLEWTIKLLNYLIFLTESLPFSVIDNIQITPWQCGLLMVVVFSGVIFLQHRRMVSLVIMIGSVTAISAISLFDIKTNALPSRLVVYKVSGSSAYDLMESGQTFFFADSSLVEMESRIKFHVQPNRLMHHCNNILLGDKQRFSKGFAFGRLIAWHGKHILQLTDRDFALPYKFRIDYLIISNNSVMDLGAVLQTAEVSQIIVDSSNSFKFAEKLLRDATLNNWKLHSVWHHGAFNKTI
jgi:competence protein ComEC